ncbi:MAG: PQQ-binding-like beta-propeller repeat protein [Planctomycetaceae bacterium]
MRQAAAFIALICLSFCSLANAGNWAHWRGPDGNGTAVNSSPPTEWSSTKNVKWKVALPGRENSSPVIWENQVFVTTAVPVDGPKGKVLPKLRFNLLCLDRQNGSVIWENTATVARPHQATHNTSGFASASPCTDGQHVYAHFGSRGLFCYSLDGDLKWKREDFGKMDTLNNFGEGSSPTLEGDKILVAWDHQGPSALYALNKLTGDTIWKIDRDEPTGWATPLVVEHDGRKQIVMNGQNFARSYDLETGKELWRCTGQTVRPICSPVAADGIVFVGSGYKMAFMGAFRLNGRGDIKGTDQVVWTIDRSNRYMTDMASPLLSSGRIYFHKGKVALLSCVDAATGEPYYESRRVPGLGSSQVYASPIAAGGHIYLTAVTGTTTVIEDSAELSVVATNSVDEFVGATPAPVDNELFIRGEKHLFCIAEAQ